MASLNTAGLDPLFKAFNEMVDKFGTDGTSKDFLGKKYSAAATFSDELTMFERVPGMTEEHHAKKAMHDVARVTPKGCSGCAWLRVNGAQTVQPSSFHREVRFSATCNCRTDATCKLLERERIARFNPEGRKSIYFDPKDEILGRDWPKVNPAGYAPVEITMNFGDEPQTTPPALSKDVPLTSTNLVW